MSTSKHKSHKTAHPDISRKHKLQAQLSQVRRRRGVTAVFGALVGIGLLVLEYRSSVPVWLWLMLWVIPLLLVMDTVYLKHLRAQIRKHP